MSTSFVLNGKPITLDADPNMPLLWAVRELSGLPGTKFGCGMALCGGPSDTALESFSMITSGGRPTGLGRVSPLT